MDVRILALAVFIIMMSIPFLIPVETETSIETFPEMEVSDTRSACTEESLEELDTCGSSYISVPAVDENGTGSVTVLKVEVMPGSGRTLTDINQLLFWVDTQYSIKVAKAVAGNYTKINLTNVDIIYAIETDADIVEGPSAGAALTAATVASLENRIINQSVMITGSINLDGTISPVGGVLEKAVASKNTGAKLMLVPEGQSRKREFERKHECIKLGPLDHCTTRYVPVEIDIEESSGIEIVEVANISEALKYLLE